MNTADAIGGKRRKQSLTESQRDSTSITADAIGGRGHGRKSAQQNPNGIQP